MRYNHHSTLRIDARRITLGTAANQSQESLDEQLKDLHVLASRFGLYDAADWLKEMIDRRQHCERDFGELPIMDSYGGDRMNNPYSEPTLTLEEAIVELSKRKSYLADLFETPIRDWGITTNPSSREDELDKVLELLRQVNYA